MDRKSVGLLAIGVIICMLSCSSAIKFTDCGSKLGKLLAISVAGCESTDVCPLKKGVNASFEVDFVPNQVVDKLSMLVYGHIAGVDIPFPLPNPNACSDCNVDCPVQVGKTYQYRNNIFVKNEYPPISLSVKLQLQDSTGAVVVCGMLKAHIESSNSAL